MSKQGTSIDQVPNTKTPPEGARPRTLPASTAITQRRARPRSREEAEVRYIAARDAWTAAMRAASSGKPADLAALAIAQEAYEEAVEERERWNSGERVAITVEPERPRGIDAIVDQELEWRRLHGKDGHHRRGLRGFVRRITGR